MRIESIGICGPGEVATLRVAGIAQEPDRNLLAQWIAAHAAFRV